MKVNRIHYSIRLSLLIALFFVLFSVGFMPAIAQDSSQTPPHGYDQGVWVLTNRTSTLTQANDTPFYQVTLSVTGNSVTSSTSWIDSSCSGQFSQTNTWTAPPSVLTPGTEQEITTTAKVEGSQSCGGRHAGFWMSVYVPWKISPAASVDWYSAEPVPAPVTETATWQVQWGRKIGDTTTIEICPHVSAQDRGSIIYTYTYQASAPESSQPTDKEVENHPPTVTLSYSLSAPTDQDLIEFTAEASDPDGDELKYSWFVDDEEQSDTGSTMSKTLSPGDHTVTVKVSDDKGETDEDSVHFTVTPSSGVSGDVLEAVYLQPITDATVTVEDPDGNVIRKIPVDENGKYSVLLPPGTYRVWASAPGYLPSTGMSGEHVEVTAGKISDWINFRLVMEPINGVKPKISTKSFEFAGWGAYMFADISGKRYFAAYLEEPTQKMLDAGESIPYLWQKSIGRDLQKNGQLSEVLMDDNEERTLTSSEPLKLEEGYELAIMSIDTDGNKVYLELSKDGQVVDAKLIKPFPEFESIKDRTYYYKSDVGRTKKVVQIAVYFKNAFRGGSGIDLATVGGLFQISDSPLDISGGD